MLIDSNLIIYATQPCHGQLRHWLIQNAEVPSGLDRAKVRTLIENANTLGFLDKSVRWEPSGNAAIKRSTWRK